MSNKENALKILNFMIEKHRVNIHYLNTFSPKTEEQQLSYNKSLKAIQTYTETKQQISNNQ